MEKPKPLMRKRVRGFKIERMNEHRELALDENALKYSRGSVDFTNKRIGNKKLRKQLEETKEFIVEAATAAATAEVLLPGQSGYIEEDEDGGGQKVFKYKQKDIKQNVDLNTAKSSFDLHLANFGPYKVNYSRNGRYMLLAGVRGHVAALDCIRLEVGMELQLKQDVHDIQYLHNETLFAAAQKKYA